MLATTGDFDKRSQMSIRSRQSVEFKNGQLRKIDSSQLIDSNQEVFNYNAEGRPMMLLQSVEEMNIKTSFKKFMSSKKRTITSKDMHSSVPNNYYFNNHGNQTN